MTGAQKRAVEVIFVGSVLCDFSPLNKRRAGSRDLEMLLRPPSTSSRAYTIRRGPADPLCTHALPPIPISKRHCALQHCRPPPAAPSTSVPASISSPLFTTLPPTFRRHVPRSTLLTFTTPTHLLHDHARRALENIPRHVGKLAGKVSRRDVSVNRRPIDERSNGFDDVRIFELKSQRPEPLQKRRQTYLERTSHFEPPPAKDSLLPVEKDHRRSLQTRDHSMAAAQGTPFASTAPLGRSSDDRDTATCAVRPASTSEGVERVRVDPKDAQRTAKRSTTSSSASESTCQPPQPLSGRRALPLTKKKSTLTSSPGGSVAHANNVPSTPNSPTFSSHSCSVILSSNRHLPAIL